MIIDEHLSALFADRGMIEDEGFTDRVMALTALEGRLAARRKAVTLRIGAEAAGLGAVLCAFALLARSQPVDGIVPLASPAMIGLMLLASWVAIGMRAAPRGS